MWGSREREKESRDIIGQKDRKREVGERYKEPNGKGEIS